MRRQLVVAPPIGSQSGADPTGAALAAESSETQFVDDELREQPGYDGILLSTCPPDRSRPVEHMIAAPTRPRTPV